MPTYADQDVITKIVTLQTTIENWARAKDLWIDCGFKSQEERNDWEPMPPVAAAIMWFEGPLHAIFNGFSDDDGSYDAFHALVNGLGFECELLNGTTIAFFATDPELAAAFDTYFRWQWICQLIRPDCDDVYEEMYAHFAKRPEDLHRLGWREFEILLHRIFQNRGFQSELGPGRGDGGVDIRLLQRDPIGDVMTLVQAKRYAPHSNIRLDAVAALHGIATVEGAQKSLFVTTSAYEPVAKRFAARTSGAMELATSRDVAQWCEAASAGIIADKSGLVSRAHVGRVITEVSGVLDSRVVHATFGYDMSLNSFALVIKETKHAALLMALPKMIVSHDGYEQTGYEGPVLDDTAMVMQKEDTVWRTRRTLADGMVSYWDGSKFYRPWNGRPAFFSLAD
ncbi:restriction endonuclease [Bradyrhizobium zhanjiangense]|uniref:restriction endonuclease n=1 Tax=Bradyrhizobium zhanjiangense TaxID=1325107 RepID=UPI001008CC5D|nr:restriction endonuclease [Bradyrhizobium zhanjiangense]